MHFTIIHCIMQREAYAKVTSTSAEAFYSMTQETLTCFKQFKIRNLILRIETRGMVLVILPNNFKLLSVLTS